MSPTPTAADFRGPASAGVALSLATRVPLTGQRMVLSAQRVGPLAGASLLAVAACARGGESPAPADEVAAALAGATGAGGAGAAAPDATALLARAPLERVQAWLEERHLDLVPSPRPDGAGDRGTAAGLLALLEHVWRSDDEVLLGALARGRAAGGLALPETWHHLLFRAEGGHVVVDLGLWDAGGRTVLVAGVAAVTPGAEVEGGALDDSLQRAGERLRSWTAALG